MSEKVQYLDSGPDVHNMTLAGGFLLFYPRHDLLKIELKLIRIYSSSFSGKMGKRT